MTLPVAKGRGGGESVEGLCLKLAEIQLEILRTCLRTWPTEIEAQPEPVAAAGNGNGFVWVGDWDWLWDWEWRMGNWGLETGARYYLDTCVTAFVFSPFAQKVFNEQSKAAFPSFSPTSSCNVVLVMHVESSLGNNSSLCWAHSKFH